VYDQPRLAGQHGSDGYEATFYKDLGHGWQRPWRAFRASVWYMGLTLGVAVMLTLLVPVAWGDPLYRKMAIVSGSFLLAMSTETFHSQHYFAPVWAALGLMIAVWAEYAWNVRIGTWRIGRPLVVLALLAPALTAPLPHLFRSLGVGHAQLTGGVDDAPPLKWSVSRKALIDRLSRLDRNQLVIVRYPWTLWRVKEEWVYNGADIDRQHVIFAHDFGPDENRALLNHYPDRAALLLTFDPVTAEAKVQPYSEAADGQ
jgi:hypothetical protein